MAAVPFNYSIRSLFVRRATSLAAAAGIAIVVFVFASAQMLINGVKAALAESGNPTTAIVLSSGSDYELSGAIEEAQVNVIGSLAEVAKDGNTPLAAGEIVMVALLPKKEGAEGAMSNVTLRGVTEVSLKLRPRYKIIEGTAPKPGTDEAIIGKSLRGHYDSLLLGKSFELTRGRSVRVVGVFEDGGSAAESEVWIDRGFMAQAYGRTGLVSSIRVKLSAPGSFDAFKDQVEHDKRLGLSAWRETDYLSHLAAGVTPLISILGGAISFFFALAATLGAMVTMYSTVANRTREIGTLRALGFTGANILFSLVLESVVLSLLGGAIGIAASMFMRFASFSVLATGAFSEMYFRFEPTPKVVVIALGFAMLLGLIGGLLPAVRAARIPAAAALRAR